MVDYTADELLEEVTEIAKTGVLGKDECFACFVNAHGNTNEVGAHFIQDQDGDSILLDDIVRPFRTCEQLRGKPKVFFVNSCRGSNVIGDAPGQSPADQRPYQQSSEANEVRYVEGLSDCLVVFSTSGGAVSWRDPVHGTGFVKALVEAFNLKRQTTDVLSIMNSVNYAVVHEENYILDADKKEVQLYAR